MIQPAPTFKVEIVPLPDGRYAAKVFSSALPGSFHKFIGLTEKEAHARAYEYVFRRLASHLKSQAAIEARKAGRQRQIIRAIEAAHSAPGEDAA